MTTAQFEAQIDHIGRVYENAKDAVLKSCRPDEDMKQALDGLQELRNIACENLQNIFFNQKEE